MPPFAIPSLIKEMAAGKCLIRLELDVSVTEITLYFKSFGKNGLMPEATYRTCVIPAFLSKLRSEAAFKLPR